MKKDDRERRRLEVDSLQIDAYRLDEEWNDQPVLYARYAVKAADARRAWDEAKANLEVVSSELDRLIRKDPNLYDLGKLTEPLISSTIVLQPEYKEANSQVIETHHAMDVVNAFVEALDQRRSALSKLVDLFLADYYSRPKPSSDAKAYTEELEKKAARGKVRIRDRGPTNRDE